MNSLRFPRMHFASMAACLFAGLSVAPAAAETWYYTAPNTDKTYHLSNFSCWTNAAGATPTAFASGDVRYLYGTNLNSATLKTVSMTARNSSSAHTGSIVVGDADAPDPDALSAKGIIWGKYYSNSTFENLVLVNGRYEAAHSGSGTAEQNRARIAGTVTVRSPEARPFQFCRNANSSGLGFMILADIVGESGTGFQWGGTTRYAAGLYLSGDNSGYHGKMLLTADYDYPSGTYDFEVTLDSPTALGGSCPSAKADAVEFQFYQQARVIFSSGVGSRMAAENRGITLTHREVSGKTTSDPIRLETEEGVDVELALPIAGTGVGVVKAGPGRLTLSGAYSAGDITRTEGELCLASASAAGAFAGTFDGSVEIRPTTAETVTLSSKTLDGARLSTRIVAGQASSVELDSGCTMTTAKTTLALLPDESVYGLEKICLLKIPTAVRTVTADDFTVDLSALPYGLPRYQVAVETSGGVQSVVLNRLYPVVFRADGAPTTPEGTTWNTSKDGDGIALWSDENAVHAGADYALTNGYGMREVSGVSFAGESVTLANRSPLMLKVRNVTLENFTLAPDGCLMMGTVDSSQRTQRLPQNVRGSISVTGTEAKPSRIASRYDGPCALFATLQGSGVVQFQNTDSTGKGLSIVKSSQSDFQGRMVVNANADGYSKNTHKLQLEAVDDPLGGSLAAFDYRALTMLDDTTLLTTNVVTLANNNRGILIRDAVAVDVGSNGTMSVDMPVTFNGTLTKSGNGTLLLNDRAWFENDTQDGVTETPTAAKNKLILTEGVLGGVPQAFSNLALTVTGGTLRLDPTAGGDCGILPQSLTVSSDTLDIAVSTASGSVSGALLTVDDATATALEGKVRVTDPDFPSHAKGISCEFVSAKEMTGYKTLVMSYEKRGMVIIYQ